MVRDGDAAEMARDWEMYLLFSCQKTKNSICNTGNLLLSPRNCVEKDASAKGHRWPG